MKPARYELRDPALLGGRSSNASSAASQCGNFTPNTLASLSLSSTEFAGRLAGVG
jgi:hypothetical protein